MPGFVPFSQPLPERSSTAFGCHRFAARGSLLASHPSILPAHLLGCCLSVLMLLLAQHRRILRFHIVLSTFLLNSRNWQHPPRPLVTTPLLFFFCSIFFSFSGNPCHLPRLCRLGYLPWPASLSPVLLSASPITSQILSLLPAHRSLFPERPPPTRHSISPVLSSLVSSFPPKHLTARTKRLVTLVPLWALHSHPRLLVAPPGPPSSRPFSFSIPHPVSSSCL